MKPIRIVLAPTRSRPLNIFLGLVLLLFSTLLLLALATYHATDPSLNTATDAVGDPMQLATGSASSAQLQAICCCKSWA